MELRKFIAPTMAECLARVKSELGPSAVILSTRTAYEKRWLGLLRREVVEITAGRGVRTMPRRRPAMPRPPVRPTQPSRQLLDALAAASARPATASAASGPPGRDLLCTPAGVNATYLGFAQEVGDLKKVVGTLVDQFRRQQAPDIPAPFLDCFGALRRQQVSEELAREIIFESRDAATGEQLADPVQVRQLVCGVVEKRLQVSGPLTRTAKGRPHIVALIGPTGVGKTTTVAKLAANLKLRENCKIGLITIDTYRIAAIDQLKKYAEIINAPLSVVSQPAEIKDAIARMADHDFILIDTAGRSPRDAVKLKELRAFLEAAGPDEVHLVLSTVCGIDSLKLALERFSGVRADRVIFTKLDEAAEVGVVLNVVAETKLPLSYLTHGQDVPNDIDVASAGKMALMMTEPSAATTAA